MREAVMMVPKATNAGVAIPAVLAGAVEKIIAEFGGATVTDATGYWKDAAGKLFAEPMNRVAVAMEDTAFTANKLAEIAEWVAVTADQYAVYVRNAAGDVLFIEQPVGAKEAA